MRKRKIQQRMIFKSGEVLFVFTYKKTANGKIANAGKGKKSVWILQH